MRLVIAGLSDTLRAELTRYGTAELLGADGLFDAVEDAVVAFQARPSADAGAMTRS